jgi:DNA-binding NarL/FixJ family response regulator
MLHLNAGHGRTPASVENSTEARDLDAGQILVVGSARDFPQCYSRLIETEIAGLRWAAMGDVSRLPPDLSPSAGHIAMIMVGEHAVDSLDHIVGSASTAPGAPPVVLAYRHPSRVAGAFATFGMADSGVSFLPMRTDVETWISIVRLVLSGGQYLPPELIQNRISAERQAAVLGVERATGLLTKREATVLELVAEGRQNKQIAAVLSLSEHTVKMHVHRACRKLGAHNRTEAALLFREQSK